MRVKPLDVLVINKIANKKSAGGGTQLANECQFKRRNGPPTTD